MSIARAKYKDMTKKERKKEQILGGGVYYNKNKETI
jgi:hypothetical protein